MEKLFISLATCELLSIWSDADSAPDEINSCIDWVTTWGTGPWTGLAQPSDEFSDWNVFSRVRSCPLRQEIFCRLEILDIIIGTLILWSMDNSPLNQSFHGINMALKVPSVTELPGGIWRCCLSCFHSCVLHEMKLWLPSVEKVQLTGTTDSLLGVTGNSSTSELPWALLQEPFQPFALPDMRKGSSNCCSSPNLFNASVTLSPSSLSEVTLKMGTVNWEKTMC